METCGNCRFARNGDEAECGPKDATVECHRMPPTIKHPGYAEGFGEDTDFLWGEWPKVFADQWCGEWEPARPS